MCRVVHIHAEWNSPTVHRVPVRLHNCHGLSQRADHTALHGAGVRDCVPRAGRNSKLCTQSYNDHLHGYLSADTDGSRGQDGLAELVLVGVYSSWHSIDAPH